MNHFDEIPYIFNNIIRVFNKNTIVISIENKNKRYEIIKWSIIKATSR